MTTYWKKNLVFPPLSITSWSNSACFAGVSETKQYWNEGYHQICCDTFSNLMFSEEKINRHWSGNHLKIRSIRYYEPVSNLYLLNVSNTLHKTINKTNQSTISDIMGQSLRNWWYDDTLQVFTIGLNNEWICIHYFSYLARNSLGQGKFSSSTEKVADSVELNAWLDFSEEIDMDRFF